VRRWLWIHCQFAFNPLIISRTSSRHGLLLPCCKKCMGLFGECAAMIIVESWKTAVSPSLLQTERHVLTVSVAYSSVYTVPGTYCTTAITVSTYSYIL
jgi:hypothetical protein